jgi:hypothetical protein
VKRAVQLEQIKRIAVLIQDRDLSRLSAASAQKAQTESQLAALNKNRAVAGLDPVMSAQVADRFGLWTTNRRILLNQKLARETVTWMAARTAAQLAFGRAEVLGKLLAKR